MIGEIKIIYFLIIYLTACYCERNCANAPQKCEKIKYRSFDGSCNNLKHPDWGIPLTTFRRLVPPVYGDGISSYRTAESGKELPNARRISSVLYPDKNVKDSKYTLSFMQYGQIITHDMAMVSSNDTQNLCCTEDLQFLNETQMLPMCAPISIPSDDPYYSKKGAKCISFARIFTDKDQGCGEDNKPVDQITMVNSYLDLSIIYGNGKDVNSYMRLNKSGLLRTRKDKCQEWPLKSLNITTDCILAQPNDTCFYASDPRINQNPQLTVLHIIFYKEHNRLARKLAKVNPHWDDDTLFEEARKINIAQHQWISYYEWLTLFMNRTILIQNKIIYDFPTYHIDDYDTKVDPTVLTEHNNGAFRVHTQIAGYLNLVNDNGTYQHSLRISDWYWRSHVVEQKNYFNQLTKGLTTQFSLASDEYHDEEITHFWFRRGELGYDIKAIDIQRSRDVGIAPYNKIRAFCNLTVAKTFDELKDIPKPMIEKLKRLYETPNDIDMLVGGSVEELLPDAAVGPTFHCILLKQFWRTRVGDRFWFERSGDEGFTLNQLNDIRMKTTLSRLICGNTKGITKIQWKAMEKIDKTNPLVSCDQFPDLDFNLWKN